VAQSSNFDTVDFSMKFVDFAKRLIGFGSAEGVKRASFLMAEQLHFQAARGIRDVMVWTEIDNLPTHNLNAAFSFRAGPECFVFTKSLR
jgi:hypothetical protein